MYNGKGHLFDPDTVLVHVGSMSLSKLYKMRTPPNKDNFSLPNGGCYGVHIRHKIGDGFVIFNYRGYGSPFNHSDEEKVHLSPRSSSTSLPHHPHQQQRPPATPNAPSTPRNSGTAERRETPSTSTAKAPLTRRKWLESSIQGLIFGGGGEEEDRRDGNQEPPSDDDWGAYSPTPHSGIPSTQCEWSQQFTISLIQRTCTCIYLMA